MFYLGWPDLPLAQEFINFSGAGPSRGTRLHYIRNKNFQCLLFDDFQYAMRVVKQIPTLIVTYFVRDHSQLAYMRRKTRDC